MIYLSVQIGFHVNAGDGLAVADIGFDLDGFLKMNASLLAGAKANASTGGSNAGAAFLGCMDIWTGFDIEGGCDGDFFDIFPVSVSTTLFSDSWDLFKVMSPS